MRAIAKFLLACHVLGLVWFASSLSGPYFLYAAPTSVLLALTAFASSATLARFRVIGFALTAAAMLAAIPVVVKDLALVNGPDHFAITLRLLSVFVPLLILWRAKGTPPQA